MAKTTRMTRMNHWFQISLTNSLKVKLQSLVKSIENIETEFMPFNSNISKIKEKALQNLITTRITISTY